MRNRLAKNPRVHTRMSLKSLITLRIANVLHGPKHDVKLRVAHLRSVAGPDSNSP